MFYYFICDQCEFEQDVQRSIKEGPPIGELNCPTCDIELRHVLGGNFILKGDWPGKSLKASEITEREKTEKLLHDTDVGQKEANEVLLERRKGRKSWKKFREKNPKLVQRVKDNRRKGIKSTLPKEELTLRCDD